MLSDYISLPVFLISFAIGIFFIYIIGPEVKTLYVYPTPSSVSSFQYKDSINQCFEFNLKDTSCPLEPKFVPIQ
jgi:hypothetical protein